MGRPLVLLAILSLSAATLFAQQPAFRGTAIPQPSMPTPDQMRPGGGSVARPPETPKSPSPQAPVPAATQFDSGSLQIKYQNGGWQLWAGPTLIKDFGRSETEAREALQLFRELRVNARGVIGGVFEFWLADGEAPSGIVSSKKIVSFNPAVLRVELIAGAWCLRDDHVVLYNFGPSKANAESALAVCRRYGFNQLGYVGQPTPYLKYLMRDQNAPPPKYGAAPVVPASARMTAAEDAWRPLAIPQEGIVGSVQMLDARRLELRRDGGRWQLAADKMPLWDFGSSEREARTLMQALQQFRCTEICKIGESEFGFFLANGRAPWGTLVGLPSRPINRDGLAVRQVEGSWGVYEDRRRLFDFGANAEDARHALAALKYYQFDTLCPIGGGHLGGLNLLVKSRGF